MEAIQEFTPRELFDRWVIAPLNALRPLPNGDGAFVAMGMALALYERYIKSALKHAGKTEKPEDMWAFGGADLGVDPETFRRFWGMYRDGIQHSLQPKLYTSDGIRWGWEISAAHSKSPKIIAPENDLRVILIEPWGFIDHVIERFKSMPELIDFKDSWKFGKIRPGTYERIKMENTWSVPSAPQNEQASTALMPGTGICPDPIQ